MLAFLVGINQRIGPKMRPHSVQHPGRSHITKLTGSILNAYHGYLHILVLLFSQMRNLCYKEQNQVFIYQEQKNWSRDWIKAHMHMASSQIARLWLSVKVVSGCTVLFMSRIINCSQEETFGNLLSRLEEDKFSGSRVGHVTFFFTGFPGLVCD